MLGVNITPVAFLIVQNDTVKLLEATHESVLDKLVEYVPDVIEKVNKYFEKSNKENNETEYNTSNSDTSSSYTIKKETMEKVEVEDEDNGEDD